MHAQEQDRNGMSQRQSMNMLYFVASVLAAGVTPFFRARPGREYPGMPGFLAMLLILGWAGFGNAPELIYYLGVWLIAVGIMRISALMPRSYIEHSRYGGRPWLAWTLAPWVKESTAKGAVEPLLCLIAGLLLMQVSEQVGRFVMVSGGGIFVVTLIEVSIVRRQVMQAQDAEIEMQAFAQRMRGQRDY